MRFDALTIAVLLIAFVSSCGDASDAERTPVMTAERPATDAAQAGVRAVHMDSARLDPRTVIAKLRRAPDAAVVRARLVELGFSEEKLAELADDDLLIAKGHALLEPASVQRAETFAADLDRDAADEHVSQVILAPMPDATYREQRIVYLIALHDDATDRARLLAIRIFDESRCDEYPERPLTFRFEPSGPLSSHSTIIFDRIRTEACGARQRAWYQQHDTLGLHEGVMTYRPGPRVDEQSLDFGTQLDEIMDDTTDQ